MHGCHDQCFRKVAYVTKQNVSSNLYTFFIIIICVLTWLITLIHSLPLQSYIFYLGSKIYTSATIIVLHKQVNDLKNAFRLTIFLIKSNKVEIRYQLRAHVYGVGKLDTNFTDNLQIQFTRRCQGSRVLLTGKCHSFLKKEKWILPYKLS